MASLTVAAKSQLCLQKSWDHRRRACNQRENALCSTHEKTSTGWLRFRQTAFLGGCPCGGRRLLSSLFHRTRFFPFPDKGNTSWQVRAAVEGRGSDRSSQATQFEDWNSDDESGYRDSPSNSYESPTESRSQAGNARFSGRRDGNTLSAYGDGSGGQVRRNPPLNRQSSQHDDDVQTRSFERGQPRQGAESPGERTPPFRRTLLKKELFEKQGKQLAENLGVDERDVYGWKKDDLRDADNLDDARKRPQFRRFDQRDIFRDKIGQPSEPSLVEERVSTDNAEPSSARRWVRPNASPDRTSYSNQPSESSFIDSRKREYIPEATPNRKWVRPATNVREFTRPEGRIAPSDFQNEVVKPFVKPKLPGLDVGPTIDQIQPKFYGQRAAEITAPYEERSSSGGYNSPQERNPQQWLRKPPVPPRRYKPVAKDGEIQFVEEKGRKKEYTGLEQEEDDFWDEQQDPTEMSFAQAALKTDLEIEDIEEMQFQLQEVERAEKLRRRRALYRAETLLEAGELKRLRRDALKQRWFIKIGQTGVTGAILDEIHKVWRNLEVCKLKVREGALLGQMRHLHDSLEEKTGGLVILRTGTLIHMYRGPDYQGPPPRPKVNDITEAIGDYDLFGEDDDLEEGDLMEQFEVEDGISSVAEFLLRDDKEDVPKFAKKLAIMSGGDKLEVKKRLTDKPVRWLPPGQSAKLTNFEMMMLRRKGKRIKPAFVLGQQRRFDGLAAAIMEYWERNEIVKISCRAVINANLEKTAKAIQDLIGGVLLVKEGGLISLYRGKDYLPLRIGEALRRYQQRMIVEKEQERAQEENESGREEEKPSAQWVAEAGTSTQEFEQELEEDKKVAEEELGKAEGLEALEVSRAEASSSKEAEAVDKATVPDSQRYISDAVFDEHVDLQEASGSDKTLSGQEAASEIETSESKTKAAFENRFPDLKREASPLQNETEHSASADLDSDGLDEPRSDRADAPLTDSSGRPIKLVKDLVVLEDEVPQARIEQMLEAVAAYRRRDIETLTPEERAALRKKGLSERRFLQVGRRGVFSGTIQNIHLHWKRHELCKIKCTGIRAEIIPIVAEQLAVESGGVLVDYLGTTILLYRGKNYIPPQTIVPVHMLNKQEALRRAKAEQRAQSLLELEIQRQEELEKARKRLEYSLQLEKQPPPKRKEYPLAPGVREFVVIPEAVELNTNVEMELRKTGPLIPKEHNQPDLPAFWRAPDMSPLQKKKIVKQAKQERTNAFLVGKRGITEGLGLTIRQHFYKHAFAKVSLKQRPNGITVKECMIELERLTGGICVAKEPTRVVLYRGWEPGTDPPWLKKDPETGEVVLPRRPLISEALRGTDTAEEAGDLAENPFPSESNAYGEDDDFTIGSDEAWATDDEEEETGEESDVEESGSEEELKNERRGEDSSEDESQLPPVLFVDNNGVGHSSLK